MHAFSSNFAAYHKRATLAVADSGCFTRVSETKQWLRPQRPIRDGHHREGGGVSFFRKMRFIWGDFFYEAGGNLSQNR